MSADLGNLYSRLRLQCKRCQWVLPADMQMAVVQAHMDVDHDTGKVELALVPACTCGTAMEHTGSRPAGGGRKDYFRCPADGNTGFIRRAELPGQFQTGGKGLGQ